MCSQQTPDTCVRQVIQLVSGRHDSAGASGVKGETKVFISVSGGSFLTMDVGLSTLCGRLHSRTILLSYGIYIIFMQSFYLVHTCNHGLFSCCNPSVFI